MTRVFWLGQAVLLILVTAASLAYKPRFIAPRVERQPIALPLASSRPVRPLTYYRPVLRERPQTICPPVWPYDPLASPASQEERRRWLRNEPQWVTARDPSTGRLYQFPIPPNGPLR